MLEVVIYLCLFTLIANVALEYGVLLILATVVPAYLMRLALGPIPTTLLELQILVLCAIVLCRAEWRQQPLLRVSCDWRETILMVSIAAFVISASISIFVSPDIRAALGVWRAYIIEPLLFFGVIISTLKTPTQVWRGIGALSLSAAIIACVALAQVFFGYPIPPPWDSELRATGIFPYPNAVGLFIAPIIPLIALYAATHSGWRRYVALVVCALTIGGIVAAKTGGALVALAVTGMVGAMLWSKQSRQWCMRIVVCAILLMAVLPVVRVPIERKLFFHEWSGTVRQIVWKETLPMLTDRWLTGAGLAGYQKTFEPYHKTKAIEIFLYPHNIILNFWSETGFYGLTSVIALITAYFILLRGARRTQDKALLFGLVGAMTVILIHGSVDVPYFKNDLALLWWTLFAFTFILYRSSHTRHA